MWVRPRGPNVPTVILIFLRGFEHSNRTPALDQRSLFFRTPSYACVGGESYAQAPPGRRFNGRAGRPGWGVPHGRQPAAPVGQALLHRR